MNKKCKDFYRYPYIPKISVVVFLCIITILLPGFSPLTVHADRAKGDAYFQTKISYFNPNRDYTVKLTSSFSMEGDGHFNVRTTKVNMTQYGMYSIDLHVFSDAPFTCTNSYLRENIPKKGDTETFADSQSFNVNMETRFGNISCYYLCVSLGNVYPDSFSLSSPNIMEFTDDYDINDMVKDVDLTKDSWQTDEQKRKNAVYDSSLDLTRLSGKINNDLNTNNPRPTEDFDMDMQWDYKSGFDVKDSYIEFVFYGNVYSGLLNTTKTWTNITFTNISRDAKKHKFYFTELYEKAFEKTDTDGNQFLPEYIYVTCYGEIENTFCRSRVYKVNIRYDHGIPYATEDPVPLPEEYFPDPDDPDPGPKDPTPDDGDYTDFDPTPIPDPVPTPDGGDILSYLRWLLDFLNGLSSSLGEFPVLVNELFGFLPQPVIFLLGASIVVIVILRFLGR